MSAISDYLEDALINHIFRNTDFTRPANIYVAAFTVAPSDAGGGTEVTGGAYARQAVATGASSGWTASSGGNTDNNAVITYPTATANWGTVVAIGLFDALTVGNMLFWGFLSTTKWAFTAETTDIFTANGHALINDDRVILKAFGGSLPAGVSGDTVYFVVQVSGQTFKLSLTQGGAAIDITAAGGGIVYEINVKVVNTNDIFRFNTGDLDVSLL